MTPVRGQRGVILVVVIAMMSILSILAVTFTMMSRMERNISKNYTDMVRAEMLATAGMDAAMLQIKIAASQYMYDAGNAAWFYIGTYVAGLPQPATPIDQANFPSYKKGNLTVDGQPRAYSGILQGTYQQYGDTYALKIQDLAGRLNINGHEQNLAGMLDALGRGIQLIDGKPDPIGGRGARIITYRDTTLGGMFKSPDDLLGILTQSQVNTLINYVSLYSWVDRGVIKPTPQGAGWPTENYNFQMTANDPLTNPPQPYGRHPLNVNTAPLPCLFACTTGLAARIVVQNSLVGVTAVSDTQARAVALAIGTARQRTAFTTWDQFETWCNANLTMLSTQQIGVFEANANPNTRFNKFCPDAVSVVGGQPYGRVADKTDLTYNTTEMGFSSYGWFSIESLGRVLDQNNNTVASAHLRTIIKLYDVVRQSSQRDFVQGAGSTSNFSGTISFPENMADQGLTPALASPYDGQIQIAPDHSHISGELFYLDNSNSLCSNINGQWHERWYSNLSDQGRRVHRADLCDNNPEDSGQPWVPSNFSVAGITEQAPNQRGVENLMLPASQRNSIWGSDLFPDGHMLNRRRNKVNIQPGVDQYTQRGLTNPISAAAEWWMKQDLRGGSVDALYCQAVLGKNQNIPSGPDMWGGQDGYGYFVTTWWLNGGHWRGLTAGVVLPQCRKDPSLVYPFGSYDYLWLSGGLPPNLIPPAGAWNKVRVEISNWTLMQVFINNALIASSTAFWVGPYPSNWVVYNATNVLDITEFGYLFLHSYLSSFDWIFWEDGMIDTVRVYNNVGLSGNPSRFPTSNGGAYYQGSFDFSTILQPGQTAQILNIGYTQIKPRVMWRNGGWTTLANPPYVGLFYQTPGSGTWTSGGTVGDGWPVNAAVTSSQKLGYQLKFYDNGLTPNNVAAYADDVTVFYSTGPQIYSYAFDPQ